MHNIYFTFTLIVFTLFSSLLCKAQVTESKNISAVHLEDLKKQWASSPNPAGIPIDRPSIYSRLQTGFEKDKGSFKQPQYSDSENTYFIKTNGNVVFDKYYLEGDFSYSRNARKGLEYNASLIDPLRNMPYIIADTNSSDWLNQHYNLGFKLSTITKDKKWNIGLAATYATASGAKQRDIRSEVFVNNLEVQPGFVYRIDKSHHIGTNLYYRSFKEESRNSLLNTNEHQGYFQLLGLGNGTNHVGTGRTMNYQGDAIGFNSQYQFRGFMNLMLTAGYTVQAEDANISFTNRRPLGTILNKQWKYSVQGEYSGSIFTQIIKSQYLDTRSKGIEYLTQFESGLESDGYYVRHKNIRSTYDEQQADISYIIIRNRAESYSWKAHAKMGYSNQENRYILPESNMLFKNIYFGLAFDKIFLLSAHKHQELCVGVSTVIKDNRKTSSSYSGGNSSSLIVTDLLKRNIDYLSAGFTTFEVPVMYSQKLKRHSDSRIFLSISAQYTQSDHDLLKDRKSFLSSVGLLF